MSGWKNKLYYGDNLDILRDRDAFPNGSVDLIYLDPPFNSKATYNVLFREDVTHVSSVAQIEAFDDTWHWDEQSEAEYKHLLTQTTEKISNLIASFRNFLGTNDMMAYLVMMASRLIEMQRVLKGTGSLYLHCDPTASHYLKLVLDAIFGFQNFRNEIIWHYRRWTGKSNRFQRLHDVIFYYTKTDDYYFNVMYNPYTDNSLYRKQWYHTRIKGGEVYETSVNEKGVRMGDVWDIPVINSQAKERLGYPTQKPEALLERVIEASCPDKGIVLDPFCGCGTTIAVAERMNRKWIGIDITHLAINVMKRRLFDTFGADLKPFEVFGEPKDMSGAQALSELDRYQFQWWALSLIDAFPLEKKKGADQGVDGIIVFTDDATGVGKKIVVSVKSGHVNVSQIRDLVGVITRKGADMGVFITLEEPTKPMKKEAAQAGFYTSPNFGDFPKIQIYTVEQLLKGVKVKYPAQATQTSGVYKQAVKHEAAQKQDTLLDE